MKSQKFKGNKKDNNRSTKGGASANSSSYLAEDENFQKFSTQLARLGLELRDVTGDGNCCFRALSDQMNGNESNHLEYRKRVCTYMRQNREEFEPFVAALIDDEDEQQQQSNVSSVELNRKLFNRKLDAFEKYIKNLEQAGTYADNGCLVAFARLYQVNINIHQLNMPIWTINGTVNPYNKNNKQMRELHLSYHNGEHYSSIRPLGDKSHTPTNILFQNADAAMSKSNNYNNNAKGSNKNTSAATKSNQPSNNYTNTNSTNDVPYYVDYENGQYTDYDLLADDKFNSQVDEIVEITNCLDINLIKDKLLENNLDSELVINYLLMQNQKDDNDHEQVGPSVISNPSGKKENKKQEKKMRQMERQKIKALEQREKEILSKNAKSQSTKENSSTTNANNVSKNSNESSSASSASAANALDAGSSDFNIPIVNLQTKAI